MISLGSRLIACCKLAPLARKMWIHNYVIDRNEYLIFTLSESVNPWVYSLQFSFISTNNSWRYERQYEWVFFSEHSVYRVAQKFIDCNEITPMSAYPEFQLTGRVVRGLTSPYATFIATYSCNFQHPVADIGPLLSVISVIFKNN